MEVSTDLTGENGSYFLTEKSTGHRQMKFQEDSYHTSTPPKSGDSRPDETINGHLVWIYSDALSNSMDAATWLETSRELRLLGWQVTLIAAELPGVQHIRGSEVLGIYKPPIYLLRQAIFHLQILRYLLRQYNETDIVLFHQMSLPWFALIRLFQLVSRQSRPVLIMDTRTLPMIPDDKISHKDRLRYLYDRTMNRLANQLLVGQTSITAEMAHAVGIPAERLLATWPSGVSPEPFKAAAAGRQWPDKHDDIHIMYVGVLHFERNLLTFCRAIENANRLGMKFRFTMVGDGSEREDLALYAAQTDGRIRLIPPVAHTEIPHILANAHIGVLAFPDEEKFRVSSPIKLFEYMAAGLPILATRIACHTNVIQDNEFVFWAEDATVEGLCAALLDTWHARMSLATLGHNAALYCSGWTWQASAKKLSDALNKGLER